MQFSTFVESGHKALVVGLFGRSENIVEGPVRIPFWKRVRKFTRHIVNDGERCSVYDESGNRNVAEGPTVVHVHPDGRAVNEARHHLAANEALVVIKEDGIRRFIFGKKPEGCNYGEEASVVFISPNERVHQFRLTGGGDADGLAKQPGALRFEVVRLNRTQAYFAVPVRTNGDHTPLVLKLMIFFRISDLERFVSRSDDPFGVLFNQLLTSLVNTVSGLSFDEFKKEPNKWVEEQLSDTNKTAMAEYGLELERISLRGWIPEDREVQRVLNEAALANTRREIQRAQHAAKLEALAHEKAELEGAKANQDLRGEQAAAEGTHQGRQLAAMISTACKEVTDVPKEHLTALLALEIAGRAVGKNGGQLALPQSLLQFASASEQ